ncbi:uncharacterized protein N7496_002854 [Penicillium cataractarum]|uniref:Uncharacterized protein n=1 Tax=Penicillium cataractarum TaxID=2100454 RepID=A0A9W9VI84_9EURO|nr:uncharacterized protein N7496_002854 [Penicillium cataractarum]KAJ5380426.1 hypothetical protein N7496_002854 [Penicillium cataractarum]
MVGIGVKAAGTENDCPLGFVILNEALGLPEVQGFMSPMSIWITNSSGWEHARATTQIPQTSIMIAGLFCRKFKMSILPVQ